MKPIIQGAIDALTRRLQAAEEEIARLRRASGGLSTVVTDTTLSGNGSASTPLSAAALIASLSGAILNTQIFTASSVYTPSSGTTWIRVRMVAGGGGGGGSFTLSSFSVGGGGASGQYLEKWFAGVTSATGSITIGAGGAGGSAALGTTGATGGNTVCAVNGVTYVAVGGLGGTAGLTTGGPYPGGAKQTVISTGDFAFQAEGEFGAYVNATPAITWGGAGGSSPFGAGGGQQHNNAIGKHGTGYGAGGGGMRDGNGTISLAGGSGSNGIVVIDEYARTVGGGGGGGSGGSSVTTDATLTGIGSAASPLSASPLSGTMDSAVVSLSGTINAKFLSISPVGSLSLASGSSASTNFSTLGVNDWMFPDVATANPTSVATTTLHSKQLGGWIRNGYMWVPAGITAASKTSANTYTSTALDDTVGIALNTTTVYGYAQNPGASTGFGFKFSVPSKTATQVCRVYTAQFNNVLQLSASLSDGSSANVSSVASAPSADLYFVWTITFKSSAPGWLNVSVISIGRASGAGNQNIFCEGVSLGIA